QFVQTNADGRFRNVKSVGQLSERFHSPSVQAAKKRWRHQYVCRPSVGLAFVKITQLTAIHRVIYQSIANQVAMQNVVRQFMCKSEPLPPVGIASINEDRIS